MCKAKQRYDGGQSWKKLRDFICYEKYTCDITTGEEKNRSAVLHNQPLQCGNGIQKYFGRDDICFFGVVVTNWAGSPSDNTTLTANEDLDINGYMQAFISRFSNMSPGESKIRIWGRKGEGTHICK